MKLSQTLLIASLVALGATDILQHLANVKGVTNVNGKTLGYKNLAIRGDTDSDPNDDDSDDDDDGYTKPANDSVWFASECRGAKLMFATTQNPPEAIQFVNPLTSPWDGDMRHELAMWGYKEDVSDPESECEIGAIQPMLDALGISKDSSVHGGPNHCFSVEHGDSDIVERDPNGQLPPRENQHYNANGRRCRVTGAYATIIINPRAGLIFFLRRGSAGEEARSLWHLGRGKPAPDELPALRATSDIAWGFWNRVSGDKLADIHGFVSIMVTNDETRRLIDRVLRERELDEVPVWPGIAVEIHSPEYMALLGSPNGRAVGYFLAQHKAKIGGNRCVKTIVMFRGNPLSQIPNLLFTVDWAPSPPANAPTDPIEDWLPRPDFGMGGLTDIPQGKVVNGSNYGKSMVRTHKVWVRV